MQRPTLLRCAVSGGTWAADIVTDRCEPVSIDATPMWLFGVNSWTAGETGETRAPFRQATSRTGGIGPKESCPSGKRCPSHLVQPSVWRPPRTPSSSSGAMCRLWFTPSARPRCAFNDGALSLGERCRRVYSARGGKAWSSASVPAVVGRENDDDRRLFRAKLLKPNTVAAELLQPSRVESALGIGGMMWFDEIR